ncbi:hypothetical protein ACIRBX_36820 [Kitasatospora sp. NPDC096147]|uniref:hypothetical protein n=1 Tax=Kitasatospora sp. NPDC096147 TaxID=3364093 RepID=UPI0038061E7E
MLYLRLARGYRPADLLRWLLTATAAAVVAALLLRALGRALGTPGTDALPRLLWCLPPLAAVGWFAAAAARAVPAARPERINGLTAAGAGPVRIRLLIAGEIALASVLGSLVALLAFLVLRNDIAGPSLAADLGMGTPLPAAAPVTLLALVPLAAGLCAALAVPAADPLPTGAETTARTGFPAALIATGTGLLSAGVALELYGLRPGAAADGRPVDLPGGLGDTSHAALAGWALAALGLALLTGPLLALAGRVLALGRPAPIRLLAGRSLTAEARRLGAPLAVLALTSAAVLTAFRHWNDRPGTGETLNALAALLVIGCAAAAVLARTGEVRHSRRPVRSALLRLGAAPGLLLGAAVLRVLTIGTVLLLTGGLTAALAAGALS